jgi:ATP-dependent Zn protease
MQKMFAALPLFGMWVHPCSPTGQVTTTGPTATVAVWPHCVSGAMHTGHRASHSLAKRTRGHTSTGAADDLAKATQIAREMVMRYGMDEALVCVSQDSQRTTRILQANRHVLERCSQELLLLETLDTQALKQLTGDLVPEPA